MNANLIGICRHRLGVDGAGITTLVALHGCGLACKYCLNPSCLHPAKVWRTVTPEQLYHEVKRDDLYFMATGGGICFGGGEPLLQYKFINEFISRSKKRWKITIETSLNVPDINVYSLLNDVDLWIIDIKDMNPYIYEKYTSKSISQVLINLKILKEFSSGCEKCKIKIRVPHIRNFNSEEDVENSIMRITEIGFSDVEEFNYIIR